MRELRVDDPAPVRLRHAEKRLDMTKVHLKKVLPY